MHPQSFHSKRDDFAERSPERGADERNRATQTGRRTVKSRRACKYIPGCDTLCRNFFVIL